MVRILGRANSINVQKVMWIVEELKLEHERIDIGLQHGGNNTGEYLAKNPNGYCGLQGTGIECQK